MAGRKLKVFQAQFGFYDTVVAAPSQAAALRAWGVNQNLFASGEAKLTTDEAAITAATAHPETPLRRAVGSSDPFALEPTSLPDVPDAPKKKAVAAVQKDADTAALEKRLSDVLGLHVSIDHKDQGGRLEIRYRTLEQLDGICMKLAGYGV